jgi:hypothetical protein
MAPSRQDLCDGLPGGEEPSERAPDPNHGRKTTQ